MSLYFTIKTVYKTVLPKSVRRMIFRIMPKSLKLMRQSVIRRLEKSADYDEVYDEKYYIDGGIDSQYKKSCEVIAESIVKTFSPKSVIDVGCGPEQLLLALKGRGVICRGLEYSSAALNICHQMG